MFRRDALSTVLYLSDAVGGATLVTDQVLDSPQVFLDNPQTETPASPALTLCDSICGQTVCRDSMLTPLLRVHLCARFRIPALGSDSHRELPCTSSSMHAGTLGIQSTVGQLS